MVLPSLNQVFSNFKEWENTKNFTFRAAQGTALKKLLLEVQMTHCELETTPNLPTYCELLFLQIPSTGGVRGVILTARALEI